MECYDLENQIRCLCRTVAFEFIVVVPMNFVYLSMSLQWIGMWITWHIQKTREVEVRCLLFACCVYFVPSFSRYDRSERVCAYAASKIFTDKIFMWMSNFIIFEIWAKQKCAFIWNRFNALSIQVVSIFIELNCSNFYSNACPTFLGAVNSE